MNLRTNKLPILMLNLKHALNNTADNFTVLLIQLMFKSDISNFNKLASIYPDEAEIVTNFKNGKYDTTNQMYSV